MQHYIGLDLGGTKTEIIVLNQNSREIYRTRNQTPKGDYKATLQNIAELIKSAEGETGLKQLPVGIGIPGTISKHTGLVKNANSTWLNGKPLQRDLESILGTQVQVMNDANCLAVSEAVDGAGKGYDLVFAAILGTGCGSGISFNQKALLGPNGVTGEWGHVPMPGVTDKERDARPCYCGNKGCVETFLSGTGLQTTHAQISGAKLSGQEISQLSMNGDSDAQTSMQIYHEHLLQGLTMIINILDPDIIVLGGGVSNIDSLYPFLNSNLAGRVFGRENDTMVVKSAHGDSSGVRGAAWLNL